MSDLYKNKYRIPPARAQWWNYNSNAEYFITICTKEMECFFGEVVNREIRLSEAGQLAQQFLLEIPQHFPFVHLEASVVMPNHVHGIIIIDKPKEEDFQTSNNETENIIITTDEVTSITINSVNGKSIGQKRFQNQGKGSISAIVGSYKAAVTKNTRKIIPEFAWQTRFHDHIIQNDNSFKNISNYINSNPAYWEKDKFFRK